MNIYYLNACYLVLFAYSVFSNKDIEDGFLSWISFSFLLFRQCDSLLDFYSWVLFYTLRLILKCLAGCNNIDNVMYKG